MPDRDHPWLRSGFGALRQFTRSRSAVRAPSNAASCAVPSLHHDHPHLVELAKRQTPLRLRRLRHPLQRTGDARYKRVSRSSRFLPNFQMTDGQWDSLMIPINMAFLFHTSLENRVVALYPSPPVQPNPCCHSSLDGNRRAKPGTASTWKPDVEALLVNRVGHARGLRDAEYYLAADRRVLQTGRPDPHAIGEVFPAEPKSGTEIGRSSRS